MHDVEHSRSPLRSFTASSLIAAALTFVAQTPVVAQRPAARALAARNVAAETPTSIVGAKEQADKSQQVHRTAWDAASRTKAATKGSQKSPAAFSSWTAVCALAFVIALIVIVARLLRRHVPLFFQGLPAEALEILGRRHIDQRQTILLVRVGSRILVVGSSPNGLHPLGELSDPVEVDLVAGLCRHDPNQGNLSSSFLKLLKRQTLTDSANPPRGMPNSGYATEASVMTSPSGPPAPSPAEYELSRRLRSVAASRERPEAAR